MIKAEIIQDSINGYTHDRLTTFIVEFPRFVNAEALRHRSLSFLSASCLSADTQIYIEKPGTLKKGLRCIHAKMTLGEIADKWFNGAAPTFTKLRKPFHPLEDDKIYTAKAACAIIQRHTSNIRDKCRKGIIKPLNPNKERREDWLILGKDVNNYFLEGKPRKRQDLKGRIKAMNLRCLNENTGEFITTKISNVFYSGEQEVYEVELEGGYKIKMTSQHRFFTDDGWKTLDNLNVKKSPNSNFCSWDSNAPLVACNGQEINVDPVWNNPSKEFDVDNLIPLLKDIHREIHKKNLDLVFLEHYNAGKPLCDFLEILYSGERFKAKDINKPRGRGNSLVVSYKKIKNIIYIGKEKTYDLEVTGEYKNFVANGIVVHNSRAVPSKKIIQSILDNPAMPIHWGANQSGMQAWQELDEEAIECCKDEWLAARNACIKHAEELIKLGLHKQITSRILEPWFNITLMISGTEWENFFALRAHKDAQPELRTLAELMLEEYNTSIPKILYPIVPSWPEVLEDQINDNSWHLPFNDKMPEGLTKFDQIKVNIARCARLSYKTFDGEINIEKDLQLYERLLGSNPKHASPAEMVAYPMKESKFVGNYRGWFQFRKLLPNENARDFRVIKRHVFDGKVI